MDACCLFLRWVEKRDVPVVAGVWENWEIMSVRKFRRLKRYEDHHFSIFIVLTHELHGSNQQGLQEGAVKIQAR